MDGTVQSSLRAASAQHLPPDKSERCPACSGRIADDAWHEDISAEIENRVQSSGAHAVAYAILRLSKSVQRLGTGNAATPFGGLELVAHEIRNGLDQLALAQHDNASAIRDHRAEVRASRARS